MFAVSQGEPLFSGLVQLVGQTLYLILDALEAKLDQLLAATSSSSPKALAAVNATTTISSSLRPVCRATADSTSSGRVEKNMW